MRTNVVIDDKLMREALKVSGLRTKRAVVDAGLRLLLQVKAQTGIRRLRGKVDWQGDLPQMRARRFK
jgi:Arc/MetJ family transcription regulator